MTNSPFSLREKVRMREANNASFAIFDSPHPTLSLWRGLLALRAE